MSQLALDYFQQKPRRMSPAGIVVVLLAHVAVLAGLVLAEVIPVPREVPALVIQVIAPPAPHEAVRTPLQHPTRVERPVKARQINPAPVLSASPDAPAAPAAETRPVAPALSAPPAEAVISQPRFDAAYLDNPAPAYPAVSRRLGEQGKVLLRVYVEADGKPGRIEIKSGSGSARLDQAAEQAVWRWKFIPAKRGEQAVAAWVVVPLSFNLRD